MKEFQAKRVVVIENLQFIYNSQQENIAVIQPLGPIGSIEVNILLPPLLAQLVGMPIRHFNVISSRSSPRVLAVAFTPVSNSDPVIPVPINCPSLIYPRSFVSTMRKFVNHILQVNSSINLVKWYEHGELLVEDVLDNINLLKLNSFDNLTLELIIKTTLAQPHRVD
jgi:hypothetical protein